jgi:hypothetical protein
VSLAGWRVRARVRSLTRGAGNLEFKDLARRANAGVSAALRQARRVISIDLRSARVGKSALASVTDAVLCDFFAPALVASLVGSLDRCSWPGAFVEYCRERLARSLKAKRDVAIVNNCVEVVLGNAHFACDWVRDRLFMCVFLQLFAHLFLAAPSHTRTRARTRILQEATDALFGVLMCARSFLKHVSEAPERAIAALGFQGQCRQVLGKFRLEDVAAESISGVGGGGYGSPLVPTVVT